MFYTPNSIENNNTAYETVLNTLDPLLIEYIDYMDFIRKDSLGFDGNVHGGSIFKELYKDHSNYFKFKITNAQRPGIHAEILAVNEMITAMRNNNINIDSLEDLVSNGVKVILKSMHANRINKLQNDLFNKLGNYYVERDFIENREAWSFSNNCVSVQLYVDTKIGSYYTLRPNFIVIHQKLLGLMNEIVSSDEYKMTRNGQFFYPKS